MVKETIDRASASPISLRGVVDRFNGFDRAGGVPGSHSVRASAYVKLIVGLREAFDYSGMADPSQPGGTYVAFLAGPHTSPACVRHRGGQSAIEIEIRPTWTRALFGVSVAGVGAQLIELEDLVGRDGDLLIDEVRSAEAWSARFAAVERFLVGRCRSDIPPANDVSSIWDHIRRSGGTVKVSQLAQDAGWSERHLRRRFRAEAGLSPKAVARIARLERAESMLKRPNAGAAQVAALCGYVDQAHLSRERRSLAG